MAVGEGRHLRQMGDADHLVGPGEPGEPPPDLDRGASTHPGVHLVEDHRRGHVAGGEHHLDGKHHPGQLATGRPFMHGT